MHFETSRLKGWLIGDPHLGRDFRNGTPLHRRGEREAMQLAQFEAELTPDDTNMIVCIGDLFDKPFVPLPVIHSVADIVISSAKAFPDVQYVFIAGNHDISRQLGVRGAWDLFELAVSWAPNIWVFNEPQARDGVIFYPWEWNRAAAEQVMMDCPAEACVGHWDLISFGGDDSHMAPTVELVRAHGEDVKIYSGHYHHEGDFPINGITVHCTGSMQPYAHGEGEMYVTLTVEEALSRDDLHDKCVRVILEPGETLPEIDCLQLTAKKTDELQEVELGEVTLGNFDIHAVLDEEFVENEVPEPVQGFIKERLGAFA